MSYNYRDLDGENEYYPDDYDPDGYLARQAKKRRQSSGSEGGPIGEENIDEVLSKAGRRAISLAMKKNAKKIQRKKEIAMKKKASPEKLQARAQKKAREMVKNKLLGGVDPREMSISALEKVEMKLDKMKSKIEQIAKKLLPGLKQAEQQRLASLNQQSGE